MSHFYPEIHRRRIDGAFKRLKNEIIVESVPLAAEFAVTPEPVPYEKRLSLEYKPIGPGGFWGRDFACGWFHVTGSVPKEWKGAHVTLRLDFGGEILLFDQKGCPLAGLTDGSVFDAHYNKDHYHWLDRAKGGERADFWCDAGANGLFGLERMGDPDLEPDKSRIHGRRDGTVRQLSLCRFDVDKWRLFIDLEVILSLLDALPEKSARRISVMRATSRALDALPPERGGAAEVRRLIAETVFALDPDPASVHVTAIGHAHIDTAWLWPFRETVRKVARTWSSQIGLIKRYPGYKFGASQAQLYQFCKDNYPKLFAKVKKAVADEDWEVQGGMWVEADCNIPSGESLVRQFLLGMRFFRDEFGRVPNNLWLPDVFGYSGNLPQILRACGIGFFLTQKLSWNRYNKFPHNSFVWEGIDGSRVVVHFPPEDDYNSYMLPGALKCHETNNGEAGIVDVAVSLFGIGDGGGGPKEEYIERGLRCAHLNGCPPVSFGFAQKALDLIAAQERDLDVWRGELYFEMHRATFTTQARQKLLNRRAEEALRVSEMLCAAAFAKTGAKYPAEMFRDAWRETCLCQFHDVIPGSSIHRVYEEAGAKLETVIKNAREAGAAAARSLLRRRRGAMALFNPSSTEFFGEVVLPDGWTGAADASGAPLAVQRAADGVHALVRVPPCSFANFGRTEGAAAPSVKTVRAKSFPVVLENGRVRYEIDGRGRVVSAVDKLAGREFIRREKPGNVVSLYDDHPAEFDAWDFEEYARGMQVAEPVVESVETFAGRISSGAVVRFKLGGSAFVQTFSLAADSARLDVGTEVEWREKHKLCRVAFPLDVKADEARFEIQYGTIARATHDNTKWQYAQFECCGHRYADVSEDGFGVALLNDCKYGYRAKDGELSLTLLRAPTEPDPIADLGAHRFTYSILPHAGALSSGDDVVAAAAELNQGVERFEGFEAPEESPLPVSLSGEGVELAVVKKAEDSDDIVVRLVERRGRRATARLCAVGKATAVECLATELADIGKPFALPAELAFKPFEIKTLRISL